MPTIETNGVDLSYSISGRGPTTVLVHGFPHTHEIWEDVAAGLVDDFEVVAPDLRGFGRSSRTAEGADAATVSKDLEGLVEAAANGPATLVAIDAGVPPTFLLALRRPELVRRLVVVESTLGVLPGAEDFFSAGPPWWFGFHAVPGLAETVLAGNEAEYVGWFYDQGTRGRGVRPDLRARLGAAFSSRDALRCALAYYRALHVSGRQLAEAAGSARLTVPTTAVGAAPVGRALEGQLRGIADDLHGHLIDECGHIVPVDKPDALVSIIRQAEQRLPGSSANARTGL